MNLLYRVWMWFTSVCTCKLSIYKHCIAISGVTNCRYRWPCLNFDVQTRTLHALSLPSAGWYALALTQLSTGQVSWKFPKLLPSYPFGKYLNKFLKFCCPKMALLQSKDPRGSMPLDPPSTQTLCACHVINYECHTHIVGCHYSLDWTTGLDYWTGLLDSSLTS